MKPKDLAYFKEHLKNASEQEAEKAIDEMAGYLQGIERGLAILKEVGKYPDRIVLENQKGFLELIKKYKEKYNKR